MIRRLRWKFILINMSLVAAVLLIVFGVICVTSNEQNRAKGDEAMRMALSREVGMPPVRFQVGKGPKPEFPFELQPVFTVTISRDTDLRMLDSANVDISDEMLDQAVSRVLGQTASEGTLPGMNLRFMRRETPDSTRIAFLDTSVEQVQLMHLIGLLALVGLGGLAAFFGISLFLANWALRPVERAWSQQQQFIADASHELKTPLTVILANLGILKAHDGETVASQAQWIDNTRQEAMRMRGLVDDMLFLAKSDAAVPPMQMSVLSVSDVLWRCVLSFEPVAYDNGVTINSDIAPDVMMVGDEGQITQLATILLDNACKYAGVHGAVTVTLSQSSERTRLTVTNTGEPIPQEDLERIFERFYRADKARVHLQGGYGLGLSIAAQIVAQHGGRIHATSSAQEGTTLAVSLPFYKEKRAGDGRK